jgi:hypothetical protein
MGIIAASRLRAAPIFQNVVLGGTGATLDTSLKVANFINVDESDIKLLEIDSDNNVKFNVQRDFSIRNNSNLSANGSVFFDFSGNQTGFKEAFFPDITKAICLSNGDPQGLLVTQAFRFNPITHLILSSIKGSLGQVAFRSMSNTKRIYLPNWKDLTTEAYLFGSQRNGAVMYFNLEMETVNNGDPHPSIVFSSSIGFPDKDEARFIQNLDKPNAVSDLTVSNITSSTVQLNFTEPTGSTNSIDFYYVYIDYSSISFALKYSTRHEISAFYDEISASGDVLTGLPSGTEITMQIQTVDYYHNVSDYSNTVTFTTS